MSATRIITGAMAIWSVSLLWAGAGGGESAPKPPSPQVYKTADRPLNIEFDWPAEWRPSDRRSALVFFYNGGWNASGASKQFDEQAAYFAKRGMVVARADYREKDKTGTTSVKCMEDIYSALRWVRARAGQLGIDPARVAAGGGSGSGHLALSIFYADEIHAPEDDLSISPAPGALFLYNPDLDVIAPEMMKRIFEADEAAARRMPPTIVFSGTNDPSNALIQDFVARTRERGMPVEAFVGEGAPHGFFKFSPWLEKTTLRVDEMLRSLGYLSEEPRAEPPSKPKPADYDDKMAQTMTKWQARHEALQKERKTKSSGAAQSKPARSRPAQADSAGARPTSSPTQDARPASTFVYKTIGERKLTVEVNYPSSWAPNDRRAAAVIYHGGADNPKDKSGNPYPMAEERARLGMPVAESKIGEAFKPLADYLAKRGMVAIRVDFRSRSKDGVMPDKCIEDGLSAMRWVRKNAATLGIAPDRIAAVGGSGGGMLAAGAATLEEFQSSDDDRSVSPKPNAMLLYYPMLDWLADCSMSESFMGAINGDRQYGERVSPLRHWRKDLPPTLVLVGTKDPMYETLKAFVARWKEQGANIDIYVGEGGNHGFSQYSPWLEKTTERADEFLRSIGYLKDDPRIEPPHRDKAEKLAKKGRSAEEPEAAAAPVPPSRRAASPPSPPSSYIYKTLGERKLQLAAPALEGTEPDVGPLIDKLRAEELAARAEAALALIEIGAEARAAFPALVEALTGDETLDAVVAARGIYAEPRPPEDVETLARGLKLDTRARTPAAWELSRIGPFAAAAVPALIEALGSEDKHARNFTTVALAMIGPQASEAVPALIAVLKDAGSAESPQMNYKYPRAGAAFALGMIGPEARGAVPALREILEEKSDKTDGAAGWEYHRAAACFALGRIGLDAKEARAALTRARADESAVVRDCANGALKAIEARAKPAGKAEVSSLIRALSESPGWTRPRFVAGLRALGEFAGSAAPVLKGSKRQAPAIHESVALAVGYLATLPKPPMPEEIAREGAEISDSVRSYLMALGGVQQGIAAALLESVKESEKDPRVAAARSLGALGPEAREAAPALQAALRDGNWLLRLEAYNALRRIDPSFPAPH